MNGPNLLRVQTSNWYERTILTSCKRNIQKTALIWRMKTYGRIVDYIAQSIYCSIFFKTIKLKYYNNIYLLSHQYLFPGKSSLTTISNYINFYGLAQALLHCSLVTPQRHVLNGLVPLPSTSLYV